MNELNADAFNFEAMKEAVGVDPFAQKSNKYSKDERFYVLSKDKEGNGAAIIRFVPDSEKGMIQQMYKINTTIVKNGKKRFVNVFSPSTIGQPCPFQETWQEKWNAGLKEEAKIWSRGVRYVANIKVLRDPANPENEGKIFMYEMSGSLKDKIQNAVDPSETDRELGAVPKEMFNPLKGNSFKLACKRGANGQINYDASEVITEVTSIYDSVDEALKDIKENTHKLSDLLKPESFLDHAELRQKMDWVTFTDTEQVQTGDNLSAESNTDANKTTPEVTEAAPETVTETVVKTEETKPEPEPIVKKDDSLDTLLDGLV